MSHPVQYMTPVFRELAADPDLILTVVYVTLPTALQQGSGFGVSFEWDVPLLAGYDWRVCRQPRRGDRYDRFTGLDEPDLPDLVLDTAPDVVLVGGWHFAAMVRAIVACRAAGIPVLYRGDSHLGQAPQGWRRRLWELRTRRLLQLFDGYLVVGSRARQYLDHFGVSRELTFDSPHCVDNGFFREASATTQGVRERARARFGLPPDAYVPLFVGKLEAIKRPLDVVRAAARLLAPAPALLFAGSGPLLEDCRREAARAGVTAVFAGFLNQRSLRDAYAAADVLVLPSERETWGLVVNEALACGLPCIVSEGVGCAPDLVGPLTGRVFPPGDVGALTSALEDVRSALRSGRDFGPACRERAGAHDLAAAARGIARAARHLAAPRRLLEPRRAVPRVLAQLSEFVTLGGLERMTLEVLRTFRRRGVDVRCLLNDSDREFSAGVVESAGVTWTPGIPRFTLAAATLRKPRPLARAVSGVARMSVRLLNEVRRTRPTHVLYPTHLAVVRDAPALLLVRRFGVATVLRVGTAPARGRVQAAIWRLLVDPFVDEFVCNSGFTQGELIATGVTPAKARIIRNCLPERSQASNAAPLVEREGRRLVFVGQVIPEKGLLELLEAVALVAPEAPDLRLDVVGRMSGWEHPSYRGYRERVGRRAAEPDLVGRVRLLGFREDVPALLEEAVALCCPSRVSIREAFGVVCLEAKAAGVPALVTPSGALPEVVRDGVDGWVCAGDDPSALADGLRRLLATPARALEDMGRAARRDAEQRYSRRRFDDAWSGVLEPGRRAAAVARRAPTWALSLIAIATAGARSAQARA